MSKENETPLSGKLYQQIWCKEQQPPLKYKEYYTSKGSLYWFPEEKQWSCNYDFLSEEYPDWWLKEDKQTAQKNAEIAKLNNIINNPDSILVSISLFKAAEQAVIKNKELQSQHSEVLKEVEKLKAAHQYTLTMTKSFPEDHVISDLRRNATEALNQYQNK